MTRPRLRRRIAVVVTLGALLTLVVLTAGFNLLLRSNLDADASRLAEARAQAALETIAFRGGRLRVIEDSDSHVTDTPVWVFVGDHAVERPRGPAGIQAAARSMIGTDGDFVDDQAADLRLYSRAIVHRGARVGTLVSGVSLEPYERSATRALWGSLIFAAAILVLIVLGVRWAVASALRPVRRITEEAADWSEHDIDHRFNVGEPTDELTELAATFDRMLDRIAESLRHEQRLTAEVSHELRTPLSAIIAEAELALRRERTGDAYRASLEAISERARQLDRILETLLAAARADAERPTGSADAVEVAERVAEHQRAAARGPEPRLVVEPADGRLLVAVDGDTAERILAPLLENAARHAAKQVEVRLAGDAHSITFTVADDGPGVEDAVRERIFEPGYSAGGKRSNGSATNGAGLGLPLARRLARSVGGEVELAEGPGGRFVARIPRH